MTKFLTSALAWIMLASSTTAAAGIGEIITDPAGESKTYTASSKGWHFTLNGLEEYEDPGTPSQVVFGENNEVYLMDIITTNPRGSFVKGTIDEYGTITVEFPQTIFYSEEQGDGFNVNRLSPAGYDEEGYPEYGINADNNKVELYTDNNGNIVLSDLDGDAIGLTFTTDDEWALFAETMLVYSLHTELPQTMPAELSTEEWSCIIGDYGYKITVGIDGDTIYLKGVAPKMPEACIIGSISGDKVVFDNNQYLGIYWDWQPNFVRLMFVSEIDFGSFKDYEILPNDMKIEFAYDAEARRLTQITEDAEMAVNCATDYVNPLAILSNTVFEYQEMATGTPRDPYGLDLDEEFYDIIGYALFSFNIPLVDDEGRVMPDTDVYYTIYVNGEPLVIRDDEYDITPGTEFTEIPFSFDNMLDIYSNGTISKTVSIYARDLDSIGVQSIYRHNGEVSRSAISTTSTVSVDSIGNNRNVKSEIFLDLSGRAVSEPKGVCIQKTVYDDGSVFYSKTVR